MSGDPARGVTVHLVDGTYELFRQFYGAPRRRDAAGREIGAVVGLARTLSALVRDEGATHGAVAFDHVIESFRNRLFAGYKTGDGVDPELRAQFGPAEEAAAASGFTVWPMVEYEADDALATAAAALAREARVARVVLCSPDKDLFQCVRGDRVVCLDRRRRVRIDEREVRARLGIAPASVPDWLALVGDAADGIPGLPGFGPATATRLLARFRSIDEVPDDPKSWPAAIRGAPRLAATLAGHREEARLYRRLARLVEDVPIDASLEALRLRRPRSFDSAGPRR